jgi:hypothetical protein
MMFKALHPHRALTVPMYAIHPAVGQLAGRQRYELLAIVYAQPTEGRHPDMPAGILPKCYDTVVRQPVLHRQLMETQRLAVNSGK